MKYQTVFGGVLTGLLALSAVSAGTASANASTDTLAGALTVWEQPFFQGHSEILSATLGQCFLVSQQQIQMVGSAVSAFSEGTVVFYSNSDCTSPIGLPTGVYPDLPDARSFKLEPRV